MNEEKIIHEFFKNSAEKVVTSFTLYKGKKLVNLRVYYNAADEGEDWRPSPKGLALRRELVLELKEAIDKAAEEYQNELPGVVDTRDALDEAVETGPPRGENDEEEADG